ncbi:MAG: DUF6456 domain-containing protein [Pseudomonadota bacterium]|jgi:hypothetical protein
MRKPQKDPAAARAPEGVDRFRAQHLDLAQRDVATDAGVIHALVNDSESPLAWLARRRGRDGRSLIDQHQFLAGERLRADFTRASLTPRVTSHWGLPTGGSGSRGAGDMTDLVVASRQRLKHALDACGPEFSGLLMDVCCFLRGLDDVERERSWPSRSAKIVLQLGLDRLARHYGLKAQLKGNETSPIRVWVDDKAMLSRNE